MIKHSVKIAAVSLTALGLMASSAWAQRTYKKEAPAGTSMSSQTQQAPQKRVSGTVLRSKDVQIRTLGQDTGQKNRLVLLQTQDGQRVVVDLGSWQQWQGVSLQEGTQLRVQGRPVRISDRPVLLAEQIMVNGKTQQVQRPDRPQAKHVTGQIQRLKEVEIDGTDRKHMAALLKTQQGQQFVVDLGATQQVQQLRLKPGMQMQVRGRPVRIGDRLVLLAQQVMTNGKMVQIERPQQMAQQQQGMRAQGGTQSRPGIQRQQAAERWEHPQTSKLNVTSASDIVDRPVRDSQGRRAGTVKYIMIDAQNGDVLYAIIDAGMALNIGQNLVAVPWSAVDLQQQALMVNKTLDELQAAPNFPPDQLARLSQPAVVSLVYDYYLTPKDQAQQGFQQQERQTQQGMQKQQRQAAQPRILVGREIVTTLVDPLLTSAQEIRGTQVESRDGEAVGEIDKVIIDPDHGHVAYVLLAQEESSSGKSQWMPVPFKALEWSMQNQNYTLQASTEQLQSMPRLPKQNLPAQVSAAHVRQLYTQFNLKPYWERPEQAAEGPGQWQGQRSSQRQGRHSGARRGASITATVQEIDPRDGTVMLQTQNGKTIDLQVSQDLLSTLQEGDRIEVTLRHLSQGSRPSSEESRSGNHRSSSSEEYRR